jgi:hypothetical protein
VSEGMLLTARTPLSVTFLQQVRSRKVSAGMLLTARRWRWTRAAR